MTPLRITSVGEIVWDLLPGGAQLGGAPANFAYHAMALGARVTLVSRVGSDDLGARALEELADRGLDTGAIQVDDTLPTGAVDVALDDRGVPHFSIRAHAAFDRIAVTPDAIAAVAEADAVCFGSLAQREVPSRAAIRTLVGAAPTRALRVLDLNLRPPFDAVGVIDESLALADVLKLNEDEFERLSTVCGLEGDLRDRSAALAARFHLRAIACTRGERGSALFADGGWSEHPGVAASVVDTVGAGDAFAAALALGLLNGEPLDRINARANEVAARVVARPGGMPPLD